MSSPEGGATATVPIDDRIERIRRTLEGVIGVPAIEGNRLDVLRNGNEIFRQCWRPSTKPSRRSIS